MPILYCFLSFRVGVWAYNAKQACFCFSTANLKLMVDKEPHRRLFEHHSSLTFGSEAYKRGLVGSSACAPWGKITVHLRLWSQVCLPGWLCSFPLLCYVEAACLNEECSMSTWTVLWGWNAFEELVSTVMKMQCWGSREPCKAPACLDAVMAVKSLVTRVYSCTRRRAGYKEWSPTSGFAVDLIRMRLPGQARGTLFICLLILQDYLNQYILYGTWLQRTIFQFFSSACFILSFSLSLLLFFFPSDYPKWWLY